ANQRWIISHRMAVTWMHPQDGTLRMSGPECPKGHFGERMYDEGKAQGSILWMHPGHSHTVAYDPSLIGTITRFPVIQSDAGETCSGQIVGIPTLMQHLLADQEKAVEMMWKAAEEHAAEADVIGLGAACAVVGLRGEVLARRLDRPVTTGNSLTCWASAETVSRAMTLATSEPRFHPRVLVVGLPGTVAEALVGVLALRGLPVEVYSRRFAKPLERRLSRIEADTGVQLRRWTDLDAAVRAKGIIVGAGSLGGELASADLRPGTVVVDVAQPLDTTPEQRARRDLMVLEGELVYMPKATGNRWLSFWTTLYNAIIGQGQQRVFACLAEPMVLCLDGRSESYSLGRKLDPHRVEALGQSAARHGFGVRGLYSGTTEVRPHELREFVRIPWLP
ncbi:MAG: hypothetical protein AAFS10_25070, partial [Myxococcota bacterium]